MGQFALGLAVAASAAWALVAIVAATASVPQRWSRGTDALARTTALVASVAVVVLVRDLVLVDPGSLYVQRFASERTPLAYRLAGLWGGMEGSLLCWSWLVGVVFVAAGRRLPGWLRAGWHVAASATTCAFLVVSWRWASPFERIAIPTGRGAGLPAILQHPAMLYHPPLLYGGLVLLGVPYALTLVAVWQRRLDASWLQSIMPWLRASWAVLGLGMLAGQQVGLRRARVGRVLGVGPGRERRAHPVAPDDHRRTRGDGRAPHGANRTHDRARRDRRVRVHDDRGVRDPVGRQRIDPRVRRVSRCGTGARRRRRRARARGRRRTRSAAGDGMAVAACQP